MKVGYNKIEFPTQTFPPPVKSYPMHCNTLHDRSNHEISPPNLRSGVSSIPHFGCGRDDMSQSSLSLTLYVTTTGDKRPTWSQPFIWRLSVQWGIQTRRQSFERGGVRFTKSEPFQHSVFLAVMTKKWPKWALEQPWKMHVWTLFFVRSGHIFGSAQISRPLAFFGGGGLLTASMPYHRPQIRVGLWFRILGPAAKLAGGLNYPDLFEKF